MDALPLVHHFSQCNPAGPGQDNVAAMLRRIADSLDGLGKISVQNISFENDVTEDGLWPSVTVYFHYGELGERCACGCGDPV